jgi:hypothetical protein
VLAYLYEASKAGASEWLLACIQRYPDLLKADNDAWEKTARALVKVRNFKLAAAWQSDWKTRENLESWTLIPLCLSLRALEREEEAYQVSVATLAMSAGDADVDDDDDDDEGVSLEHLVWLAFEDAVAKRTSSANDYLDRIDPEELSDEFRYLLNLTEAMLSVQEAGGSFERAKQLLGEAVENLPKGDLPAGAERAYLRSVAAIARDVGGLRAWWWKQRTRFRKS